ncbi:MAG: Dabb family protein [Planctomycetaceae bacterium]|nr:Dabb family protein [Planctomycetaceae bacterium]
MVRHVVMLQFKEGQNESEQRTAAETIKADLYKLKDIIPGITAFTVVIDPLPTSNMNFFIDSRFDSAEALAAYTIHPEHVKVLDHIKTVMHNRACIDYEE